MHGGPAEESGADGQVKTLKLPSAPYRAGGRGTYVPLASAGPLPFGETLLYQYGETLKSNSLNWFSCSTYGSRYTRGPTDLSLEPCGRCPRDDWWLCAARVICLRLFWHLARAAA